MFKIIAFLFCSLLVACTPCTALNAHNSLTSDKTLSFPKIHSDFIQYQQDVAHYLQKKSLAGRTAEEIKYNYPFDLAAKKNVAYQGRFLLFHGLNDSPYVWLDFAQHMSAQGFDVRAVLLEGHGSHPKHMIEVTSDQWLSAAQAHYKAWSSEKQAPLYLGGFSMGALLATSLALDNPDVQGLFLVSPAFHSKLNNMLRFSWLYSQIKTWLFGQMLIEDNPTKYNSIAINSANAYYRLTKHLKGKMFDRSIKAPVLMVHSLDDSVVDVQYSRAVFQKHFSAEQKRLMLYSAAPADQKLKMNEEARNSYFPALRMLNQSHLSLINRADNLLLGEQQKVLICNGNEYPIFSACMRATKHWYGAQHTPSPDAIPVARSTYNPDYDAIVQRFNEMFVTGN